MAVDASKVRVAITGALSKGLTSATALTSAAAAATGFTDLGGISEDGVTLALNDEGDSTPLKVWQNGATVRRGRDEIEAMLVGLFGTHRAARDQYAAAHQQGDRAAQRATHRDPPVVAGRVRQLWHESVRAASSPPAGTPIVASSEGERGGSAMRRWQPRTLAGTFLVLQLAVVALVLLVAAVVSVRQAQAQFRSYAAERILGAAESLASNPLVRERGLVPATASDLAPVAESVRVQSGASTVLLAGLDRRIVAASDPTLVGTVLALPDEGVWSGRSWGGDATLAGTGTYDADGDYEPDDPITLTSVDCGTLTIP